MAVTARNREEPSRAQRGGIGQFLRDVLDELRKVVWPTAGELYRYTLIVIFTVIILGVFIGGTDYILETVAKRWLYTNGVTP
jgi:preprotein translocase subunit SecE